MLCLTGAHAQQITNISPKVEGKEIVITYDLEAANPDALCEVVFYFGDHTAQNNLLKEATGDLGEEVTVGTGKKIRVSNIQPFLPYMKELTFKAEAKYTFVPIAKLSTLTGTKIKMKSTIPLTWEGGIKGEAMSLTLSQDGRLINDAIEIKNNNSYDFVLPESAEKGSGYKLILKDAAGREINTGVFSVKPKLPMAVIVIAAVVVVGGVVFAIINSSGSKTDTPIDNEEESGVPALAVGAHPGG